VQTLLDGGEACPDLAGAADDLQGPPQRRVRVGPLRLRARDQPEDVLVEVRRDPDDIDASADAAAGVSERVPSPEVVDQHTGRDVRPEAQLSRATRPGGQQCRDTERARGGAACRPRPIPSLCDELIRFDRTLFI